MHRSMLVALLREHIARFGVRADGRLFRSEQGNVIQPSTWWQVWQKVRARGLTEQQRAMPLLRRPYDRRHSGVTWRLNSGAGHRGGRVGRAQRRGLDAGLRQVHDRPGGRVDQPHGRRSALGEPGAAGVIFGGRMGGGICPPMTFPDVRWPGRMRPVS